MLSTRTNKDLRGIIKSREVWVNIVNALSTLESLLKQPGKRLQ